MNPVGNIKTIAKRELLAYFASPVAYVFIVIFLLLNGFFTFMVGGFFERGEASLANSFFMWHPWFYLFLVPAVGMRLWADERRVGTLELLLTMPIAPWEAIVGKFIASWLFLGLALAADVSGRADGELSGQPGQRRHLHRLRRKLADGGRLSGGELHHLGHDAQPGGELHHLGRGVFVPDPRRFSAGHQPADKSDANWQWLVDTITSFSVITHFEGFQKGVLDSRDIIFFLSVIGFSLFTTSVILRTHRTS